MDKSSELISRVLRFVILEIFDTNVEFDKQMTIKDMK